jgi:hypothetical protein
MNSLDAILDATLSARASGTVTEWCEANLNLPERTAPETSGPFSVRLTPYTREILDAFDDPTCNDLVLCFGTRGGKTTTLAAGMAYRLAEDPANCIMVHPSRPLAQTFAETVWLPLVDASPVLQKGKPANDDDFKKMEQHFQRCTYKFVGSNSPGNLSAFNASLVVCDETDKFRCATSKEAGALFLADHRAKSASRPLRVKSSTPTTEAGDIWQWFLKGDQRRFHIPCPCCGEFIVLKWGQVKWYHKEKEEEWDMDRVRATARYECQQCGESFDNEQKLAAIQRGHWRAMAPAARGFRSYQLSSLYSPWADCSMGNMAARFLTDRASLAGLQDFVNGYLAEPWIREESRVEATVPVGEYRMNEEWQDGKRRVLAADYQEGRASKGETPHLWAAVREFNEGATESRLVTFAKLDTFDELRQFQLSHKVPDQSTFVDSGARGTMIYKQCSRYGWIALKGEDRKSWVHTIGAARALRPFAPVKRVDGGFGTKDQGKRYCRLVLWGNDPIDDLLHEYLSGNQPGWTAAADAPAKYHDQVQGRVRLAKLNKQTGRTTVRWVGRKTPAVDHARDCECMILVGAMLVGILRWRGAVVPMDSTPAPVAPALPVVASMPPPVKRAGRVRTGWVTRW